MKNLRSILIVTLCFLTLNVFSQADKEKALNKKFAIQTGYVSMEVGRITGSSSIHPSIGMVIDLKNGYRVSSDVQFMEIDAPNPSDYFSGWNPIFLFDKKGDKLSTVSLNFGKTTSNSKIVRMSIETGPSLISYSPVKFEEGNFVDILFGFPSYSASYPDTKFGIGLNVKSRMEVKFGKYAGMSLNFQGNLNKYHSFLGAGFGFNFGKMHS